MWIGYLKQCKDKIENINWVKDYVKCLGIYIGYNKAECKKLNIEKQLLKSEKIMNSWKKRNITMVGRIMIVKYNICSISYQYRQRICIKI